MIKLKMRAINSIHALTKKTVLMGVVQKKIIFFLSNFSYKRAFLLSCNNRSAISLYHVHKVYKSAYYLINRERF
jgi:hypothetical protein